MENVQYSQERLEYLRLFSKMYPNLKTAKAALVRNKAYLSLPKKTEFFLTDIHGEHEAFNHVLKNASGQLKIKLQELFSDVLNEAEIKKTATLLYYPVRKIEVMKKEGNSSLIYYKYLPIIVSLAKSLASKYNNEEILSKINDPFKEILMEMIFSEDFDDDKNYYIKSLYEEMIENDVIDDFIVELTNLIQMLAVDHLHIIGDIYDRGPGPHIVMDRLMDFHSLDIQFGNHDILWMGAAAGSRVCIANVVRISARYANLDILEDGYGINLLSLAQLAQSYYAEDDCLIFTPKTEDVNFHERDILLMARMHKAISIIQFKLEGQMVDKNPAYGMDGRKLLDKIDWENNAVSIGGKQYPLRDNHFPTVDPSEPYVLNDFETEVIEKLEKAFLNSDALQKHVKFIFANGSFYKVANKNLLFHGCIPLDPDGDFAAITHAGQTYRGKALLDFFEKEVRRFYFSRDKHKNQFGTDIMWYLWQGALSPLFGKEQMTTFERYFISDKETHKEKKNPYFQRNEEEVVCDMLLKEFGLSPETSRIITGHVPVKASKGEEPVKANGKLFVIDGGFAKAYQKETGLAGYTLVYNSYGLQLIEHQPFESVEKAIQNEEDIISVTRVVEKAERKYNRDTDEGQVATKEINDLEDLINAYKKGIINSR